MASAERVAVLAPIVIGDERAAAALGALLGTQPADVAGAAADLASLAAALLGRPVSVLDAGGAVLAGDPTPMPRQVAAPDGSVALGWTGSARGRQPLLAHACVWLALLRRADPPAPPEHAEPESEAVREVVQQLLSVRDVDRVLTSIAERTLRVLDADICGVMLREGDLVRMRACVGNRVAETARLRMRRGQGLAGLVFDTGRPAKVDTYLEDRTISPDFMSLAAKEETRSALAVPLRLHGEFIGVLEVWRRRPSMFTGSDERRMVVLARPGRHRHRRHRQCPAARRAGGRHRRGRAGPRRPAAAGRPAGPVVPAAAEPADHRHRRRRAAGGGARRGLRARLRGRRLRAGRRDDRLARRRAGRDLPAGAPSRPRPAGAGPVGATGLRGR
jgi:hypothetical protein